MIRIRDISLSAKNDSHAALLSAAAEALRVPEKEIKAFQIYRRSVDARKKNDVRIIYTVDVSTRQGDKNILRRNRNSKISEAKEHIYNVPIPKNAPAQRPVVVGFGPAGMFAALILARAGLRPIVIERGLDVDTRTEKVEHFWKTGELDTTSNVQFGEGGAGTFSDGKLNTGTNDPRISFVLREFVRHGAKDNILYDAKPHVGTDILKTIVKSIRKEIISLGGEVRFGTKLVSLLSENGTLSGIKAESESGEYSLPCSSLILAIGHSARDTFEELLSEGIAMEPKPFSIGVRIEHRQKDIDRSQFGEFAGLKSLGAADYKLSCHTDTGSAYTFCMCPGGYVVAAASEEGGVVTNGMSYSGRNGENANSALLVGVTPEDFPYPGPLGGMHWQREIEQKAFKAGGENYRAPSETVGHFLGVSVNSPVSPTYAPGVTSCNLRDVLPKKVTDTIEKALPELDKRLNGFASPDAVMTAPETRSSSPVRILRNDGRVSVSLEGLYPCGEGAGYAGGITSAAVDGMRCAEALIATLS